MNTSDTGPWTPPEVTTPPPPRKRHRIRTTAIVAGSILGGIVILGGILTAVGGGMSASDSRSCLVQNGGYGCTSPAVANPAAPSAPPAGTEPPPAPPAGTEPPPAPSPSSNVGVVGDTMTITQDGEDAADITVTRVKVTTQPADPSFGEAPQNGYYVTAYVTVKALPGYTGGVSVYSGDFYAKHGSAHFDEGDGNAFEAPGNSRDLGFSNLGAGETATGTLVFDMPSPHGQIAYAPNYDGQAIGYWRY